MGANNNMIDPFEIVSEEFSDSQLEILDNITNSAMDFCRVLADNQNLEYSASFVFPIIESAQSILSSFGIVTRLPTHVTTETEDYFIEYYI